MSLNRLKELIDISIPQVKSNVPPINEDELGTTSRVLEYTMTLKVLENPVLNPILEEMGAFDRINVNELNSYVALAKSVQQITKVIQEEFETKLMEDDVTSHFDDKVVVGNIRDFSYELATKLYENMFKRDINRDKPTDTDAKLDLNDEEAVRKFEKERARKKAMGDLPDDEDEMGDSFHRNWFREVINKLRLSDVITARDLKGLLGVTAAKKGERKGKKKASMFSAAFESVEGERIHPGLVGLVETLSNEMGEDEASELIKEFISLSDEDEGVNEMKDVKIDEASDESLNDELVTTNVNAGHPKDAPKLPSTVKSDVNKRLKEINKLIKDYESEKHFQGTVKPAIFNAKNALETLLDKFKAGDMDSFKEAQVFFQTLKSPIVNLFPPSLIKFLAHGGGDEDLTKDV